MKVISIVVTYNGSQWVANCFGSLVNSSVKDHHVIAIDNGSSDDTIELIKRQFPSVERIENKKNLGFGEANNIGIRKALSYQADYVFLLNQDAWVYKDTIKNLLNLSIKEQNYGVISPLQIDAEGKIESQFSHYLPTDNLTLKNKIVEVPFVNAAAWLLSVSAIKEVGLFDSLFYHYGEDQNYCYRLSFFNYKIGIATKIEAVHDRGKREKEKSFIKQFKRQQIIITCFLSNINKTYLSLILKLYLESVFFIFRKLMKFQVKNLMIRIVLMFKIPFVISKIADSRKRSKQNNYL